MIKKDCFAYNDKKNECNACKDLECRNCAFYKESKRYIYEKAKTEYRISSDRQRLFETQPIRDEPDYPENYVQGIDYEENDL